MTLRVLDEHDLGPTLGLTSVIVRKLPAYACGSCEDVLLRGPVLEAVSSAVVREILMHSFPLGGVEVRFLRKAVGLTQVELAARLGIDRVSVARWESEERQLAGPESIAVRAVVGAAEGSPLRSQPVETLRHAPEPRRSAMVLDAPSSATPSST
jgi:DNA-binding transcriptional regulator YiaG